MNLKNDPFFEELDNSYKNGYKDGYKKGYDEALGIDEYLKGRRRADKKMKAIMKKGNNRKGVVIIDV